MRLLKSYSVSLTRIKPRADRTPRRLTAAFFVAFILTPVLIGFLLWPLIWLAGIVMLIIGIMNVAAKQMKPLPVIGKITLIK